MRQKIALVVSSIAATTVLTVALAAAGFAPGAVTPADAAPADASVTAPPSPVIQVDTVYLAPPPPQQTITIKQPVAAGEGEGAEAEGAEADD